MAMCCADGVVADRRSHRGQVAGGHGGVEGLRGYGRLLGSLDAPWGLDGGLVSSGALGGSVPTMTWRFTGRAISVLRLLRAGGGSCQEGVDTVRSRWGRPVCATEHMDQGCQNNAKSCPAPHRWAVAAAHCQNPHKRAS